MCVVQVGRCDPNQQIRGPNGAGRRDNIVLGRQKVGTVLDPVRTRTVLLLAVSLMLWLLLLLLLLWLVGGALAFASHGSSIVSLYPKYTYEV